MRTVILTIAAAAALGAMAPAAGVAQGPPPRAEAQRDQAKPQQKDRQEARGQRPAQRPAQAQQGQSQRPPRAQGQQDQRPPQARQGQDQRPPQARGQGQARGQRGDDRGQRPPQAQQRGPDGRPGAAAGADRTGPPAHARARRGPPPPDAAAFNRGLAERVVETRGRRHAQAPALQVRRTNGEVRMVRPDGRVVFALREQTFDQLGFWRAVTAPVVGAPARPRTSRDRYPTVAGDARANGAPSFCRSGEGHPVWGRNWCLDKGFGLGETRGGWAVARTVEDIVFGRPDTRRGTLDRNRLAETVGEVTFGRLALQAVVLGATDPLTGRWIGDPNGPATLRVVSGSTPVAELVDYDRDGRVDTIVFNLGR